MIAYLPGFSFVVVLAFVARYSHSLIPDFLGRAVSEVILGMTLGLVVSNLFELPHSFGKGIKFAFDKLLKLAIVLLGLRISFQTVLSVGGGSLLLILLLIAIALILTLSFGKYLGISKRLAALIGVGTAVCGNTAISAVSPAIGAKDEETSFAIATNTLFGTLAVFVYPLLGQALGLDDGTFGVWAGTAVNDTSQVVATGFSFSDEAGKIATTVKLTRNALMGFVIVGMSLLFQEASDQSQGSLLSKIKLPGFVWAFLAVATLNSLEFFSWIESVASVDLSGGAKTLTKFFILIALTGVGLNTRFRSMAKIGVKPFILGMTVALAVSLTSFSLVRFFGLP